MFNSVLLDTIIGLSFIYLVYSFLCLVITETITRLFNDRHKLLQKALQRLFDNVKEGHLVPKLEYNIRSVIGGFEEKKFYKRVSNITPAQLSEAVKMTLKKDIRTSLKAPDNPSEMLSYADKLSKMLGHMEVIDYDKKPSKKGNNTAKIDQLEEKLNERVGSILDTVYGLYTRYAQKVALFVALFIVVINNADTIKYAQKIYTDTAFRDVLVKSAEKMSENELFTEEQGTDNQPVKVINKKFIESMKTEMQITDLDLGFKSWLNESPFKKSHVVAKTSGKEGEKTETAIKENNVTKADEKKEETTEEDKKDNESFIVWLMQKITGLLLTTALVSLGAPFWLDAIKKLVGLKKKNGKQDSTQMKSGA